MDITTAVIPVAGKGTRFLPATKQIPKEMLPLVNKPMVEYAVEEAIGAGVKNIVFVTASGKSMIEDYFDRNLELENFLESNGKTELAKKVREIGTKVEVVSVRQKEQLGLGHAILCAENLVGDKPFAVILADDIVLSDTPVTKQLLNACVELGVTNMIGVMEVPKEETFRYGVISGDVTSANPKTLKMTGMVEKPKPEDAPTNLATPGRYIFDKKIFDKLKKIKRGAGGEYQLTDAIELLAKDGDMYAHIFKGDRYDTGKVEGYLEATIDFALKSEEYHEIMKKLIASRYEKLF